MDKCYNHDFHEPCKPDRPMPRPGDPCCHPPMPGPDPFAPCDKPGFAPPPKPFVPMQPVPSVCEGASLYEAVNNLTQRVNVCMDTYNHVMAENYRTLHNLQRAAEENGAYYGPREVWVEEGYCADESATYHLVHKAVVDRRGEPIRMELHLAYGNTTNSQIEQDIFSASKVTFADKIFVAQPKGENGWYGRAIWKGCPIASSDSTDLYTVGFTKSGHMRVYHNGVSVDQMLRDTIENAMGCSGILIQNGQLCDDSYITTIPNWDKQVERVIMGQNLDTKEVIFLVCGDEDDVHRKGITSKAAAKILLAYGCDIAVELCESTDAGAADKGSLMFVPKENNVPTAYAYWVISRRCFYRTDYERELAELIQNYGHCLWDGYLNKKRIERVKAELDQEILDRIAGDEQLQANLDEETRQRIEADRVLQENIDKETERAKAEEARIEGRLDDEIERATGEEQRIEGKLDEEITRAKSEEQRIETKLDEEITRAKSEESRIETKLDNEIERSTTEDKRLDDKIDQEIHDRTNEDARLHQEILTEQGERIAADEVLQTNINNEAATRASEDKRITDLLTDKINQEQTERIAADNTLQANIDAEATKRASEDVRVTEEMTALITKETNARVEADKTLQANIDAEAATRASEDVRITEEMTALITSETNARTEADKKLQANIDAEAATRASEDVRFSNEMSALVNAEVENRTNADTALGARIDALTVRVTATEADIVKLQDLTVKLQQQMTALDTSVTEILHTISDIEGAVNNVKTTLTELTNTVNKIIRGEYDLAYVRKSGDIMSGPLQMASADGIAKGSFAVTDDGVSIASADGTYIRAGGDNVTVGGNAGADVVVRGVAAGVDDNDAVNKSQMSAAIQEAVQGVAFDTSGLAKLGENNTFTGTNWFSNNVDVNGAFASRVSTQLYGDADFYGDIALNGKENVSFGGNQIHDLGAGTADEDAVNKKQLVDTVNAAINSESAAAGEKYVKKTGDTMSGKLIVNADEDVNGTLKAMAIKAGPIDSTNFVTVPSGYAFESGDYQFSEIDGRLHIGNKSGVSSEGKVQITEYPAETGHDLQISVNGEGNTRTVMSLEESGSLKLEHDEMQGGSLVAGNVKVSGVADGTASNDAVNKGQMDSAIQSAVAGVTFDTSGLAKLGSNNNFTANNTFYGDVSFNGAARFGSSGGPLEMGLAQIKNVGTAVDSKDAVNKEQMEEAIQSAVGSGLVKRANVTFEGAVLNRQYAYAYEGNATLPFIGTVVAVNPAFTTGTNRNYRSAASFYQNGQALRISFIEVGPAAALGTYAACEVLYV